MHKLMAPRHHPSPITTLLFAPRQNAQSWYPAPSNLPRVVRLTDRLFIFPHRKGTGGHWLDELALSLPAQAYGIVAHHRMLLIDAVWPDTLEAALHTCTTHALEPAALVVTHGHFLPVTHPAWHACLAAQPLQQRLLALPSVAAAANAHAVHTSHWFQNLLKTAPWLARDFGLQVLCWQGHSGADALLLWDGCILFPGDCATGPSLARAAAAHSYGSPSFFQQASVAAHFTRCACVVITREYLQLLAGRRFS